MRVAFRISPSLIMHEFLMKYARTTLILMGKKGQNHATNDDMDEIPIQAEICLKQSVEMLKLSIHQVKITLVLD